MMKRVQEKKTLPYHFSGSSLRVPGAYRFS